MKWFDSFRPATGSVSTCATVTFDDEAVTCRRPSGLVESVRWADLEIVFIETTDAGPAVDDVFWVLAGADAGCVEPSEAKGIDQFLQRLQRLPGFAYDVAIQAMTCTTNKRHLCWRRPNGSINA